MGLMKDALKKLGLKILGIKPSGDSITEIVDQIAKGFDDGNVATKPYVNSLMSGALKRLIVEELPTENIDTNTIYMVLDSEASQEGNVYNEYLYIEEAWELIGTTEVQTNHLYKHLLYIFDRADSVYGFIEVLTTSSEPFTSLSLFNKVKSVGKTFQYMVSPYRPTGNVATVEMHGIGYNSAQDKWNIIALDYSNVSSTSLKPQYIEYRMDKDNIEVVSEDIEQIF